MRYALYPICDTSEVLAVNFDGCVADDPEDD